MRLVFVILVCIVVSGCGSVEVASPDGEARPRAQATTADARLQESERIVWRDEERGFTVSYPDAWQRAASPLTPYLSDPRELFALGTYELRPGGDRCAHQPVNAVEDLGTTDGLIVVFERAQPYTEAGYPPRQGPPELVGGTNRLCVPDTGRLDGWFALGESGRAFYVLVALGESASEETRAQLYAIYDGMQLDER